MQARAAARRGGVSVETEVGAVRGDSVRMSMPRKHMVAIALCAVLLGTLCSCIGPGRYEMKTCACCGMGWKEETWLGIRHTNGPFDTDLSRWYVAHGLKPHEHRWVFTCAGPKGWPRRGLYVDASGDFLLPLLALRDVQPYIDEGTFRSLCGEYYACVELYDARRRGIDDRSKAFVAKCQKIINANQPDAGDGG